MVYDDSFTVYGLLFTVVLLTIPTFNFDFMTYMTYMTLYDPI
jgi:hypothetical protein